MSIKALHIFNHYLPQTVNWAYNLITNMPDVACTIASPKFAKTNFYPGNFKYIQYPYQFIQENYRQSAGVEKLFQYALLKMAGGYEKYLYREIENHKPDLIHAHFAHVACRYRRIPKKLGIPYVVSFYGLDYEYKPFINPELKAEYKSLFQDAQLFLCEGEYGASVLEKMGCPSQKIKVARLGVDTEKINPGKRTKAKDHLRLIQIASLKEKKGHIYALKAFHEALKTCPNMTLTLVGSGDKHLQTALHDYVATNQLEEKVELKPSVDYSQLYSLLLDYDVFIHPSTYTDDRNCEGGAPVVLLDAHATGMPVISTLHCDIPSEVVQGKTGLLTEERDHLAMAKSIETFYAMDNDVYQDFSKAARRHIESDFDIRHNAVRVRNFYAELVKK